MRLIFRRCVLLGGIISVLVVATVLQFGNTTFQQISVYQRWFSLKLFRNLNDTLETVKNIVRNGTLDNTSDNGICAVGYSTQHNQTSVNNRTFYITPRNINKGRLGNMIFKYASMLGIARRQGRQMFIKPDTDLGKTFKLQYEAVNEEANVWPTIKEANPFSFDVKLMNLPLKNLRIDGYLQSFCYFAEIIQDVRQEFTFQDDVTVAAANILRDMYVKHNDSMIVGVHARRGDFLAKNQQILGYRVPERSYFMKAFSLMKSKFPFRNITFVVVSDDLRWCREKLLGENVIVMPHASPAVHLAVLSSCDHVIISGGTFGWWAGWLANGYVIYYKDFMVKGTKVGNRMNEYHYYPRQWIGLEN